MSRQYVNIRLSYEAKLCIEKIQSLVQLKLNEKIAAKQLNEIENNVKNYLCDKDPILANVSITNVLKVSTSSIIEEAYNYTQKYSSKEWFTVAEELEREKFKTDIEVGSLTPKLYLDEHIIQGLKANQEKFMKPGMIRVTKLSYVIKLVVYAYAKELKVLD